jgi:hypothetical protein
VALREGCRAGEQRGGHNQQVYSGSGGAQQQQYPPRACRVPHAAAEGGCLRRLWHWVEPPVGRARPTSYFVPYPDPQGGQRCTFRLYDGQIRFFGACSAECTRCRTKDSHHHGTCLRQTISHIFIYSCLPMRIDNDGQLLLNRWEGTSQFPG